jgi:hypothetical protein
MGRGGAARHRQSSGFALPFCTARSGPAPLSLLFVSCSLTPVCVHLNAPVLGGLIVFVTHSLHSQPDTELFVVCTHFKAKTGFEAMRLAQAYALTQHITRFVHTHSQRKPLPTFTAAASASASASGPAPPSHALSDVNLVICGDFNEEWVHAPIQYLATHFLCTLCHVFAHHIHLKSGGLNNNACRFWLCGCVQLASANQRLHKRW